MKVKKAQIEFDIRAHMSTVTTKDSENNIFSNFANEENMPSDSVDVLDSGQAAVRPTWWDFFLKRVFDIYASFTALLILAPILIIIAALIRLETQGSPLFSQTRWGKDGKKITVYKFRSMRSEACDPSGVIQTVENDPRITFLGRILRKTNLDELPQLFNVLRGDMSLVGPRCHAIGMLAGGMLYEELVPAYHRRHLMRPGLTGLAQMRGLRGPTDRPAKARARINADLHYIENFDFWLDMKIIVGTIVRELRGGNGF